MSDIREQIETSLAAFGKENLKTASISLLNSLGYQSEKTLDLDGSPDAFLEQFSTGYELRKEKALFDRWESVHILFQFTDTEVKVAGGQSMLALDTSFTPQDYQSYLFVAIDLKPHTKKLRYTRTRLAVLTREVNRLFSMPVILFIRERDHLTIAAIDRRLHKRDTSKDVLDKVRLLRDIDVNSPHRAYIEILSELHLPTLIEKYRCRHFRDLHAAWGKVLDLEALNKQFYRRIQEWFFWATQEVSFPVHGEVSPQDLNRIGLIRLLTRLVFCWFAREKGIIPARLFDQSTPETKLKSFDPASRTESSYYLAFLQNLFFPTLSVPLDQREFRNGRRYRGNNKHYMHHEFFRHETLFKDPDELGHLFAEIPFLNGGLFECLDSGTNSSNEVRVDGFSDVASKQPTVPNALFFGRDIAVDLADACHSEKKANVKVDGLFHILNAYKFTIAENTPIEEEIALDPELLGRIFENLLAEFNPETEDTARRDTGSFYTPRTIVDYMVNVSIKAYLKKALLTRTTMTADDAEVGLDILLAYTEREHPFTEPEKQALVDAIYDVTILDPACGSGAFPIGMLQKLVYVLEKLDVGHAQWKQRILAKTPPEVRDETRKLLARSTADHNWKLGLIQNCIYGVDIQPIAVQIAKLRCFVALLVDFDVDPDADNMGVPALPNLDFKFVPANTLIRPPSNIVRGGDLLKFEDPFFQEFAAVAKEYFYIRDPAGKKDLRTQLERLVERRIKDAEKESRLADRRAELQAARNKKSTGVQAIRGQKSAIKRLESHIARIERDIEVWRSYLNIFAYRDGHVEFFDPPHFFPEIDDGFDIVIGNPPYKQIQKYSAQEKADWVAQGYATYAATADIYCLFYERGAELLRPGGSLCYITSNKWMRAGYGDKLREFLCQDVATRSVLDFGMAQNFGAATTYTCITHLQRERDPKSTVRGCYVSDDRAAMADPGGYFEDHSVEIAELDTSPWVILSPERTLIKQAVADQGVPLARWDIAINYGIKTGLNDAFYLTQAQRDTIVDREPHATAIIVPLLRGRYVERYAHRWDGTWLINTHNGVKGKDSLAPINAIQDYPVV